MPPNAPGNGSVWITWPEARSTICTSSRPYPESTAQYSRPSGVMAPPSGRLPTWVSRPTGDSVKPRLGIVKRAWWVVTLSAQRPGITTCPGGASPCLLQPPSINESESVAAGHRAFIPRRPPRGRVGRCARTCFRVRPDRPVGSETKPAIAHAGRAGSAPPTSRRPGPNRMGTHPVARPLPSHAEANAEPRWRGSLHCVRAFRPVVVFRLPAWPLDADHELTGVNLAHGESAGGALPATVRRRLRLRRVRGPPRRPRVTGACSLDRVASRAMVWSPRGCRAPSTRGAPRRPVATRPLSPRRARPAVRV
jgi:hypothetical protein